MTLNPKNTAKSGTFLVGRGLALGSFTLGARRLGRSSTLFTILLILLVLAVLGGGVGHSRFGYTGWSPAGILVVILLVMLFTGHRI